jgi:hypothetical protein
MKIIGRIFSTCIIFFAVMSIMAAAPVFAQDIGTISFIDGRVDILKSGQNSAIPVESGAPVSAGDIIRTKSNSGAEITLSDGTVIRLAQSSRVVVADLNNLNLLRGRMRTIIPAGNAGLQVLTPNGIAKTGGTDLYFIYENGSTWFYGSTGSLQASNKAAPGNTYLVEDRTCVRIAAGIPMAGSCAFKDIDVEKYAWDTSTDQNKPVVASLPAEGTVYTYTPLSGRAVTTPSLPVPIAFEDLACPQCPPEGIPLEFTTVETKQGDWNRVDDPDCGIIIELPIDRETAY